MTKIMKKIVTVAMVACTALGAVGCVVSDDSSKTELNVPTGMPNYEADADTLKVRFGGWSAPPPAGAYGQVESFITEKSYQEIADCGLDFINGLYERNGSADVIKALDCAAKAGVKYFPYYPNFLNLSSDTISVDMLYESYKDVLEHEACMGIFACDEPSLSGIKKLGKASELFVQVQEKYNLTDKYLYANLFPTYASSEQLGTSDYREYLNNFGVLVKNKLLSVDYYPFSYNGFNYNITSGLLAQLELTQIYAKAYGKEHWQFLQASYVGNNYLPDYYDYAMQIYASMAYGAQVLQYFCYWSPAANNTEEHLIASDGSKTERWYDAQKINNEIHNFDHVYMNYVDGWQGVMPVVGENNAKGKNSAFDRLTQALTNHERIKSISAKEDTIVGCFKDKNGYDGFLAVNYSVPADAKADDVTINFRQASKAIVYSYGEQSIVDLEDGVLNITLDRGQGAFIIPIV